MSSFTGKVAIITGASDGIGAELAGRLAAGGASVVLSARSEQRLAQVQATLVGGRENSLIVAGDITLEATRTALISATLARFGRIDILINNAGRGSYYSTLGTTLEEARSLFELNFFAPLALAQAAAPHLRQSRGSLVNISSIAGQIPLPWLPLYSATKFALASITSTLRAELARDGIHVMGVFPGYVDTAFQTHAAGQRPPDSIVKGKRFAISVEGCAEAILHGLAGRRKMVVTPRSGWPLVWLGRLMPLFLEGRIANMETETVHGS